MRCPFLRESEVKFCENSPYRKLIPRKAVAGEKCSSAAFRECPAYREHGGPEAPEARCPFLRLQLAQHCGASHVVKFIPYSEALLSRCGTDAHQFCEVYLSVAIPPVIEDGGVANALTVRERLHYAPNHMWLDLSADGGCHIGIDAFAASVLGSVERITYLTLSGTHHPALILSAGGVDVEMVFPNAIRIGSPNFYLRANPSKLIRDPYGSGWLFEGTSGRAEAACAGLVTGNAAARWMVEETAGFAGYLRQALGVECRSFEQASIRCLNHEQLQSLFSRFFSPQANWTR